jgi:hypothetical protein
MDEEAATKNICRMDTTQRKRRDAGEEEIPTVLTGSRDVSYMRAYAIIIRRTQQKMFVEGA